MNSVHYKTSSDLNGLGCGRSINGCGRTINSRLRCSPVSCRRGHALVRRLTTCTVGHVCLFSHESRVFPQSHAGTVLRRSLPNFLFWQSLYQHSLAECKSQHELRCWHTAVETPASTSRGADGTARRFDKGDDWANGADRQLTNGDDWADASC